MENYTLNNVGVLCHEMFHSLGAPDLYHYPPMGNYPVGEWDIMEITTEPPQSMGAYMKFKYGKWIDEIPVINTSGFYEINPLQSGDNNICYKIPIPETSQEYILVEYRQKSGVFEEALPANGLLIYRIWPNTNGNTNPMIPDEVYIYRPGGGYANNWNQSAFSYQNGRGNFHRNITDPACVLTNMNVGSVGLHHIQRTENNTIRFYVALENAPYLFVKEEMIYLASASNATRTIDVHTNLTSWDVSTEAQWLSISKDETESNITFTTLSSNGATTSRTAFINISGGDFEQTIRVIQYAGQTTLTVTPRTQTVDGQAGASAEYTVSTTYIDWNATTTANWVKLNIDLENNILTAKAITSNPQSTERQATIRVTSGTTQVNVFFVQSVMSSIIQNQFDNIVVYPNPTTGEFKVSGLKFKDRKLSEVAVEVYDIMGIVQSFETRNSKPETLNPKLETLINISHLPSGIYFIKIQTESDIFTEKIIKK